SRTASIDLPRKLKGSDMVLFAVLKSLGLPVKVLPVLEDEGGYFPEDPRLGTKPFVEPGNEHHYISTFDCDNYYLRDIAKFREKGYMTKSKYYYGRHKDEDEEEERVDFHLNYWDACNFLTDSHDIEARWKALLMGRTPYGRKRTKGTIVGTELHPHVLSD